MELSRLPIEHVKPIGLLTDDQQVAFLKACEDWQLRVYLTPMLTGLRPSELVHLVLPGDLDFKEKLLHVRNRINFGWQVKDYNAGDLQSAETAAKSSYLARCATFCSLILNIAALCVDRIEVLW